MSRFKEGKKDLDQLLFSSQGEDSHNESRQHNFIEVDEAEDAFLFKMDHDDKWNSNDNIENQFLKINGPSVEFSQNYSQSSSMMYSHRQDDDSREYRKDPNAEKKYFKLLEEKKREELQFNEALDQELNETKKELDWSRLEISKLKGLLRGLESKTQKQEEVIEGLEQDLAAKDEDIDKARKEREDLLRTQAQRDDCFNLYKSESTKILGQLSEKDRENGLLKKRIVSLQEEIYKLNESLSIYQESDHRLLDFKGGYSRPYDSPLTAKKAEKEGEKWKKEKMSLEMEVSTLRDKLEDRESRFRLVEEEQKKKNLLKEKRIHELEQRIHEMKEEQLKGKTQNDIQTEKLEKLNASITAKNKELNALSEKVAEADKRIKALLEESRRKDQKVKEVSLESLDRNRQLLQKDKQLQETKIQLQFDQQMVEDKDREIEKLLAEKKALLAQLDNLEQADKAEKGERNERERLKREVEKLRKDNELLKREGEAAQKELERTRKEGEAMRKEQEDQLVTGKDWKKKFEEVSKKMSQLRNANNQLQEELQAKEEECQLQKEALDKAMRELTDTKKRTEAVPELKNKIILLQSRLKNQQLRDSNESYEASTLQDRIEALEQRLEEREKENKSLKLQLRTDHPSDEDIKQLEFQLVDHEEMLQKMQEEIDKRDKVIEKLREELQFKDNTLDFTHNVLVQSEKAKIELEQEKKMLEEMVNREERSFTGSREELEEFYEQKIEQLEEKLEGALRGQKEKEDAYRFQVKQQKERIRELKDMLLSKERKITPETMSQEETVHLLVKIIKRVTKSSGMLERLTKNVDFREGWVRMDQELRK